MTHLRPLLEGPKQVVRAMRHHDIMQLDLGPIGADPMQHCIHSDPYDLRCPKSSWDGLIPCPSMTSNTLDPWIHGMGYPVPRDCMQLGLGTIRADPT
jgi:hypothetical protein